MTGTWKLWIYSSQSSSSYYITVSSWKLHILKVGEDTTSPSVYITSSKSPITNIYPIPVTISFNEPVWDFVIYDIMIHNGTISSMSVNSNLYTIEIIPIIEGEIIIYIPEERASDLSGNSNTSSNSFSILYLSTPPLATISSNLNSPTNISPFPITVTFSKDVMEFIEDDITVSNAEISDFSGSNSLYNFNLTPSDEGIITINIPAGVCSDGINKNPVASEYSITYDITAPTVTLSSSSTSLFTDSYIQITATFSEPVTGFTSEDIIISNGTIGSIFGSDSIYTFHLAAVSDGIVTVDIPAAKVQDEAGNQNTVATQLSIQYDGTAPIATMNFISQTNDSLITITVTFTEPVTGFNASDIIVSHGTLSNFSGENESYTFNIIPPPTSTFITVKIPAGSAQDAAGLVNDLLSKTIEYYDNTPPVIISTNLTSHMLNYSTEKVFELQFSRPMDTSTITTDNIVLSSIYLSDISSVLSYDDSNRTLSITPTNQFVSLDTMMLLVKSGGLSDIFGYKLDSDKNGIGGDDYIKEFTISMLGDYDLNNTIDLLDLAQFTTFFYSKDYSYELGPTTGNSPNFQLIPDGVFDVYDLMTFIYMWTWYEENSSFLSKDFTSFGSELDIVYESSILYLNIPKNTYVYELRIKHDMQVISFGSLAENPKVQIDRDEGGLYILLSAVENHDRIELPIYLNKKYTDVIISFKAVDANGQIIHQSQSEMQLSSSPIDIALHQVYPNPFNPTTQIQYTLSEKIHVRLIIYDILGSQIVELVNADQQAGYHNIIWNGDQNSSGLYFVKMIAGNYTGIQKLMLVK